MAKLETILDQLGVCDHLQWISIQNAIFDSKLFQKWFPEVKIGRNRGLTAV